MEKDELINKQKRIITRLLRITPSPTHSPTPSPTHSLPHSSHSLIYSLTHSLIYSLTRLLSVIKDNEIPFDEDNFMQSFDVVVADETIGGGGGGSASTHSSPVLFEI